ncbi:MAG: hypothetical protein NUW01_00460 [Gemmatimonadaceae bacterium]|nr:hypothetical protein [Gemmatimonadaceae bacterium]
MSEQEQADGWRLVVLHPRRVLVWLAVGAATALYGLSFYWAVYYLSSAFWYIAGAATVAGFLSLVAFVGSWLERH